MPLPAIKQLEYLQTLHMNVCFWLIEVKLKFGRENEKKKNKTRSVRKKAEMSRQS